MIFHHVNDIDGTFFYRSYKKKLMDRPCPILENSQKAMKVLLTLCYSLNPECLTKAHVLRVWSPADVTVGK
jgi:hypothetical protein